jgi:catechol 2,3-dioxygenase-like lactoylglutathione lyase family enzyme
LVGDARRVPYRLEVGGVPEPLLQGINHVALASSDVDVTASFYAEVFGLEITDFTEPGSYRNVFLFFPNGSFVQVLDAADAPALVPPEAGSGTGRYLDGAPLDHFSLFAADVAALEELRDRLVALGRSDGQITDIAGLVRNLEFKDPDGRWVDVTAYV